MATAYEWRMQVMTLDGGLVAPEITVGSGYFEPSAVAALTRFDVDGMGNCLEAEFMLNPDEAYVGERNVVTLYAREVGAPTWTALYRGVVVVAGAPRAKARRSYKLVGLKQRMYEVVLDAPRIEGGDVARMVERALAAVTPPLGVTFPEAIADTGFHLGDRFPQYETLGTFLDDLASTVGTFIVPPGQTFGEYGAGEVVPAVRWGVDAEGYLFFHRPPADVLTLDEAQDSVSVHWNDVLAEEVYDRVALIFASEYAEGAYVTATGGYSWQTPEPVEQTVAHPLAHVYENGAYASTRVVPLTVPTDHMRYDQQGAPVNVDPARPWSSLASMTDADGTTYATAADNGGVGSIMEMVAQEGVADHAPGIILRIILQRSTATLSNGQDNLQVHAFYDDATGETRGSAHHYYPPEASVGREVVLLPFPVPAQTAAGYDIARIRVQVLGANGVRVYDVRAYALDVDAADRLAQAYTKAAERDPAQVDLVGVVGPVSPVVRIITGDIYGDPEVPVARVEYTVTNERGLVTTYHAGQAYDAELMSQAVVLERLAKQAVAKR